ncbi:MAG: hypothetical protein HXY40_06565 [Chloroflexi bacterium]|nr:hypothetical protein [Chloroflexota bacterium]
MSIKYRIVLVVLVLLPLLGVSSVQAQNAPAAEIENDDGGVRIIEGTLTFTNTLQRFFTEIPLLMLEDQAGFVDRDWSFNPSPESQELGQFTTPFFDNSGETVDYTLSLPLQPRAEYRDVDQDSRQETGVQIFAVAFWDSRNGDTVVDRYDWQGYGGWTTSYASTRVSFNPETYGEYIGGQIVVYAPDDEQGFPSGFGDDGLLFTPDDPIVTLPAGYTLVDMDTETFTFDRSQTVIVDTYEPESLVPVDFSDLSYTEAFMALVDYGREQYAYTELKDIDWDALEEEFLPRLQEAEDDEDVEAYLVAMYDFAQRIPDGHVSFLTSASTILNDLEQQQIAGGLGFAVRELADGRILVNYVLEGGPAQEAGIELGAEVTAINDLDIQEAITAAYSPNGPYSSPITRRLDLVRFVTRFPLDTEVQVRFVNPGDATPRKVRLTAIDERDSLLFTRQFVYGVRPTVPSPSIAYEFLPSGYGYLRVNTFTMDGAILAATMEEFISTVNQFGAPGIIIDIRSNGGGVSTNATALASYFFTEDTPTGYTETYNTDIDAFYYDDRFPTLILPPPSDALIYSGPVAVLVGPACFSACEAFAYYMTLRDDPTALVGHYPTNGIIGGRTFDIPLPEGSVMSLPNSRRLDMDGENIIEGTGVAPTILVPITEDNMSIALDQQDLILDAAVAYLEAPAASLGYRLRDGGSIEVGDEITDTLAEGERIRYTLEVEEGQQISIFLGDDSGNFDTYLRLYDTEGNLLAENDDAEPGVTLNSALEDLEIPADLTLIVEVGTYNDEDEGEFTLRIEEVGN